MTPLILVGRSSSHFTRVVAIFAQELALPYTLQVVQDLSSFDADVHGGHPGLKIPTLRYGDCLMFGTENICRKLIELAPSQTARIVMPETITDDRLRLAQELVWTTMSAQVQLRVGINVCKLPSDNVYFAKSRAAMAGALFWLDAGLDELLALLPAERDLSLFECSLFCLVEHILFLPSLSLYAYPALRNFAAAFSERTSARNTRFYLDTIKT